MNHNELVLCYKAIYINKFTIMIINIDDSDINESNVVLRHESFHIWESNIRGCFLPSNDFLILSKNGRTLLKIGNDDKS